MPTTVRDKMGASNFTYLNLSTLRIKLTCDNEKKNNRGLMK